MILVYSTNSMYLLMEYVLNVNKNMHALVTFISHYNKHASSLILFYMLLSCLNWNLLRNVTRSCDVIDPYI